MTGREVGAVEAAYKAWTDSLGGALNHRQRADVALLLAHARRIDSSPDEPLSAAATLSREMRALCDELRDAGHVGPAPDVEEVLTPAAERDDVTDIKAARERRRAEAAK